MTLASNFNIIADTDAENIPCRHSLNKDMKNELVFDVSEENGLFVAVCHEPDMATQAQSMDELVKMVRELIDCHFDEGDERRHAELYFHLLEEEKERACA